MIHFNNNHHQIRVDTFIKIIEKDGTELMVPVTVLVGLNNIKEEKDQYNFYKITNKIFNKDFILDRRTATVPKKPWWKFW